MSQTDDRLPDDARTASRFREYRVFLFTTLVLIPGLTVAFVGAYGLVVWLAQLVVGPPGPPAGS